jgi:hypothetical protein
MRTLWKVFLPLALVLPLGAFVAGSLVASATDDPPVRDTIVIRESGATPGTPTPSPSDDPTRDPADDPDDTDDGDVETVTVEPDDVDDDSDGRSDAYPGEDHSGPGGGDDGSSGPGGGDDDRDDRDDDNSGHGGGDD